MRCKSRSRLRAHGLTTLRSLWGIATLVILAATVYSPVHAARGHKVSTRSPIGRS